jgi:hypothetical protein
MKSSLDYYSHQGVKYEHKFNRCLIIINVLPQLKGKQWDSITCGLMSILNPTYVRVTPGEISSDFMLGRVTVYIDFENYITCIEQECVFTLDDCDNNESNINEIYSLIHGTPTGEGVNMNDDDDKYKHESTGK